MVLNNLHVTCNCSSGFSAGCTVALTVALILIVRTRKIMDHSGSSKYMEIMFPLYRQIYLLIFK